jgi:hypothetical protein
MKKLNLEQLPDSLLLEIAGFLSHPSLILISARLFAWGNKKQYWRALISAQFPNLIKAPSELL